MKQILLLIFCIGFALNVCAQSARDTTHSIPSKYFETQREIRVHLPQNFTKSESLPVIYVFDAQWEPYFNLTTSIVDYLIETGEFPKSLVVGIRSEDRQYELTPEPINEDWKMPSLGGAKLLEDHLLNEISPLLDLEYNCAPFKIGIGHSLGGTFVLNSLIDRPNLLNAYVAISPNLQIDEEEIVLKIKRHLSELTNQNKFIYTAIGTEGNPESLFLPYVIKLDSMMQSCNSATFDWNLSICPGLNHATSPLEGIHSSLLKLAEKWRISTDQKEEIARSTNVLAEFDNFYSQLTAWTGYSILPSKNDYYNFSGFLEEKEQFADAIALYKSAIERFPMESRYYNCVAENLIQLQNKKEAEVYLLHALKILNDEPFDFEGDKTYFENLYRKNLAKINEK